MTTIISHHKPSLSISNHWIILNRMIIAAVGPTGSSTAAPIGWGTRANKSSQNLNNEASSQPLHDAHHNRLGLKSNTFGTFNDNDQNQQQLTIIQQWPRINKNNQRQKQVIRFVISVITVINHHPWWTVIHWFTIGCLAATACGVAMAVVPGARLIHLWCQGMLLSVEFSLASHCTAAGARQASNGSERMVGSRDDGW